MDAPEPQSLVEKSAECPPEPTWSGQPGNKTLFAIGTDLKWHIIPEGLGGTRNVLGILTTHCFPTTIDMARIIAADVSTISRIMATGIN